MTKQLYILMILTFQTTFLFACLNTYQFKIFPVGVMNDTIVTVDFKIFRTSESEGNRWLNLGLDSVDNWGIMWILYSYISTYDKNQKLISLTPIDTTYSIGTSYYDTLDRTYQRGLKKIAKEFIDIEYFNPDYISFCNFHQKCNLVEIQIDTVSNNDYVVYEGKKYQIDIVKDITYYGFDSSSFFPETLTHLDINSVRVYNSKKITIVITHFATGHELSMGYITNDPQKAGKTEDGEILFIKESKPNFLFSDIKKSTYEEPLLHHGYGFDIFIIK